VVADVDSSCSMTDSVVPIQPVDMPLGSSRIDEDAEYTRFRASLVSVGSNRNVEVAQ